MRHLGTVMKVEKLALKLSMLLVIGLFVGGGIGCSDGSSGGGSDDESGSANNSFLFYSQKWNYADDTFGVALPAKLELKRSIAAGDTLGSPFAEDAVAFCAAGVWGEDDTVVYYVDGEYALWSYSADGTKTLVKEAVAGAKDAFVSYDSEGKCLFVLYDSDNTADKKIFVKDTVSGKSFTVVYGSDVMLIGGITALAGSKKDSSIFIANGRGSGMNISSLKFERDFSALLDEGSEVSSEDESVNNGSLLGGSAPFTTTLKKDPIQYKITDMTVLGGKLYALFASCLESKDAVQCLTADWSYIYYYPYGNYSTAGGVLRINYSDNLSVDTEFGTDGVAGYSKNINEKYYSGTSHTVYLFPYPDYDNTESTFSTEWPTARINSNLEFNNPQKIVAIKPDELVIAENGLALTVDDKDNNYRKHYNLARAVTMDLNGKIKSVTAVHGKSFSYGGHNNDDGLVVCSTAQNTELHNDIQFE